MQQKIRNFWESVWAPADDTISPFLKKLRFLIQLFCSATFRFQKDEDLVRAASISYSIIVSAIPTLLVALLLAANFINIREYEELVREYTRKNGIPIDVSNYFTIVYELLNNTAALTGIGFLFVLFSTTSVLRNLEDAMNKIWHIRAKRPFIQKIAEFIMIVIFSPIFLVIGITTGQNILNEFSAPSLIKMIEFQGKELILGDKRILLERKEPGKFRYSHFLSKVDFEFQKEPIVFDPEVNSVLGQSELTSMRHRVKKATPADTRDSLFRDITSVGNHIFIVSSNGSLFYSKDGGNYWQARKFLKKQLNLLVKPSFTRIYFFDSENGVILGESGLILKTSNGGTTWKPVYQEGLNSDLIDIAEISPGVHLLIGDAMSAYITKDKGDTWIPFTPIMNMESIDKENLNSIEVVDDNIYICGDSGLILTSRDSGKTWIRKNIAYKNLDFHHIVFIDKKHGLLIGDAGNVRYTNDGGEIWKQASTNSDVDLLYAYKSRITKNIYLLGKNHHILANKDMKSLEEFKVLNRTPAWRVMLSAIGRFFLPFIVLWLIFFFIYKVIPYTNVRFESAAIGSLVTSFALVCFIIGFQFYVAYFSEGKIAIYGTLAAIPLVLLLIYISSIIVLYGCEIAFLVQYPLLIPVAYHKRNIVEMEKKQIWKGIQVLYIIHSRYIAGKGETTDSQLMKIGSLDPTELDRILDVLIKNNIITRTESEGLLPLLSAEYVNLEMLTNILSPAGYDITDYDPKNIFIKEVKALFDEYSVARKSIFGNKTLADLLKKTKNKSSTKST